LLARAGEVLHTDVRDHVEDEFAQRQLDAIAMVVSELGQAWNGLVAALCEQNVVLGSGLAAAQERLGRSVDLPDGADPLALHSELLRRTTAVMSALQDGDDGEGAAVLRSCLREAAEIENRLLVEARANSPLAKVRRV
jgi:hypothetical protein